MGTTHRCDEPGTWGPRGGIDKHLSYGNTPITPDANLTCYVMGDTDGDHATKDDGDQCDAGSIGRGRGGG